MHPLNTQPKGRDLNRPPNYPDRVYRLDKNQEYACVYDWEDRPCCGDHVGAAGGAPKVTHFRSYEGLQAESASLAIVPRMLSFEWLEPALLSIRRALITNGRLVISVDPFLIREKRIARMLRLHGFAAMRASHVAGRLMLLAEVPAFGLRRCA
jgi:hypothetical protein